MRGDTDYLSVFSLNAGKYGPEKTSYLDTFYAVLKYGMTRRGPHPSHQPNVAFQKGVTSHINHTHDIRTNTAIYFI